MTQVPSLLEQILAYALASPRSEIAHAANSVVSVLNLDLVPAAECALPDLDLTCKVDQVIHQLVEGSFNVHERQVLLDATEMNASWIRSHFKAHPDARREMSDFIQEHASSSFPWHVVRPDATGLAILYNFSPFQDTGATVASKRIRNMSATVDVISCSFLHRKKQDHTVELIAQPYVNDRYFLPLAASWASWEPFKAFAVRANAYANHQIEAGASYDFLYTRAMWAASHYAGAVFKREHPEIEWIAEFSDPLSLDVEGLPRGGDIPEDDFSKVLIESVRERFPEIPESAYTIFGLAELLPYVHADQILFTNSHQKKTMLEHIPSPALREEVERKAVVSNHPTLPRSYYLYEESDYELDDDVVNLGYFGEFYSSRSITEVTSAMRTLPPQLADRVHLHVFTNYIPATKNNRRPRNFSKRAYDDYVKRAYDGVGAEGIEDRVHFNASLPYLKFLATTEKLDYLIVNDARSGKHHEINPYLPSKWSDYAGSSAKSWGFIEEGSILSQKPVTVKTPVGDALAARARLWDMILDKFPELADEFSAERKE